MSASCGHFFCGFSRANTQKRPPAAVPRAGVLFMLSFSALPLSASIILGGNFEKALRVGADGADLGRLGADDDVSAVAAFPDLYLALFEYLRGFEVVEQRAVALLMVLFDGGDHAELDRERVKALFLGGLGKALVHSSLSQSLACSFSLSAVFKKSADICS